jgi:serine/threonine-protein kinase
LALLGLELRRFAHPWAARQPEETLAKLDGELRLVAQAVEDHGGQNEGLTGQRLLASFAGPDQVAKALRAAASALSALSAEGSGRDEGDPPAAAVVSGKVVTGSTLWRGSRDSAVVGLFVQQLESLLREAAPGDIILSAQAHRMIQEELERNGVALTAQRGLATTQPIFRLSPEALGPGFAATPSQKAKAASTGRVLGGRFELLAQTGEDHQGQRFEARDGKLGSIVLLDLLRPDLWPDKSHLDRLEEEAREAGQIDSPHVQRVLDAGTLDGYPFVARELVTGSSLKDLVAARGAPPLAAGLRLARQLCSGLAAAHDAGVTHGDLTPDATRIDVTGLLKITGFGVTRPRLSEDTGAGGTVVAGSAPGDAQYLSPEQREGRDGDDRSDVFACGLLLYELFTGKRAFPPGSFDVDLEDIAPPRSLNAGLSKALDQLILRCLERNPDRRFASGRELSDALYRVQS